MALKGLKLVLIGAPVAGKAVISEKISKTFNVQHIVSGKILWANIDKNPDVGKQIKSHMENVQLVPDHIVNSIILREIDKYDSWLLDGFPRTVGQATVLSQKLKPDIVLNFVVPFQDFAEKMKKRSIDNGDVKSHRSYGDKKEEYQKHHEDPLHHDLKAMKHFKKVIQPVIEHYQKSDLLKSFGGSQDEIWTNMKSEIEQFIEDSKRQESKLKSVK